MARRRPEPQPRDLEVALSIGRFKQLTPSHIYALHFTTTKHTMYRSLKRLKEARYIYSVERHRLVGGSRGGSGQHVWALTPTGHAALGMPGRPRRYTTTRYHELDIANTYVELLHQHRAGRLYVHGIAIDHETYVAADGILLWPDLHVDVTAANGLRQDYIIEVDEDNEHFKDVREKCVNYWHVFNSNDLDRNLWPKTPLVVYIAFSERRLSDLRWFVGRMPKHVQAIVHVTSLPNFIAGLTNPGQ